MRIALIITGEPRYHPEVTRKIRELIIDELRTKGHLVDVIFAMWNTRLPPGQITPRSNATPTKDPTLRLWLPDEHTAITRLLKPVMTSFMTKPEMSVAHLVPHTHKGTNCWGMYSQHYSWYVAGRLVRACEQLYGKYDAILRIRLDLNFHHAITLPEPLDSLYVPEVEGHTTKPFDPRHCCNDQVALGPRDKMFRYLRLVKAYDKFVAAGFQMTPEAVLHNYLVHITQMGFKTFPLRYNIHR